ncbi:MAG: hypothetical protein B7Y99_00395 [Caulobacterales bacterium 32-69-10]|nr:MAG: hypothetical protein B7Y99_00395 [Caulobacterales bacterium 32-69-10]
MTDDLTKYGGLAAFLVQDLATDALTKPFANALLGFSKTDTAPASDLPGGLALLGSPSKINASGSGLFDALSSPELPSSTPSSALGLFGRRYQNALTTPSMPIVNVLAQAVQTDRSAPVSVLGSPVPRGAPIPAPRTPPRRNVFFSFHFQADINRVNIVRRSWQIRPEDSVPGFWDRSLWERIKRTNEARLKQVIRAGLRGTSVTCVLAGEFTWERPWVRFEIAESLARGNGLLTVDIDELHCIGARGTCLKGPDPLAYMGVYRADDGLAYVCEWIDGQWVKYSKLTDAVPWPRFLPESGYVNEPHALSLGTSRHVYKPGGHGFHSLSRWVQEAARVARRR